MSLLGGAQRLGCKGAQRLEASKERKLATAGSKITSFGSDEWNSRPEQRSVSSDAKHPNG